ncbi:neurensin 1-like [Gadus macrocephalus]|uniref:neurensin 1-like n=1 Tax=Gadus macrocephalus TaxID=80720 RepID=UPI0028CB4064|nr:neurensin 1-like [Gadus macrocephalus]
MAFCPEPCASRGHSPEKEPASICMRFGVRSYLHHFYEECSSSMRERDPEDQYQGSARDWSSATWSSAAWKVSLALSLLLLGAGVAGLSVGFSGARRIESFGEGELLFVDAAAVRHNEALRVGVAAGALLTCLAAVLALMGACLWLLPRVDLPARSKLGEEEAGRRRGGGGRGARGEGGGGAGPRTAVTRAPGPQEGKVPVTLSKVEIVQPSPDNHPPIP